jgi:hypothetical protein
MPKITSLDPMTVAYLRRHLAMLDAEREAFGDSYHDSGKLVCHPGGRPVQSPGQKRQNTLRDSLPKGVCPVQSGSGGRI